MPKQKIIVRRTELPKIYGIEYRSLLGAGSFNTAYLLADGKTVLKIPHPNARSGIPPTDLPARSVRVWNIINGGGARVARAGFPPKVIGWTCPFVVSASNLPPTDQEISKKLAEIYKQHRRIIFDGYVPANFVKTLNGIVCIDFGWALTPPTLVANSPLSMHLSEASSYGYTNAKTGPNCAFSMRHAQAALATLPNVADMTYALHCIATHYPDLTNTEIDLLLKPPSAGPGQAARQVAPSPTLTQSLAAASKGLAGAAHLAVITQSFGHVPRALLAAQTMMQSRVSYAVAQSSAKNSMPSTPLDVVKQQVINKITAYRDSRAEIVEINTLPANLQQSEKFHGATHALKLKPKFFSHALCNDKGLTSKKVLWANQLIASIKDATSIEQLERFVDAAAERNLTRTRQHHTFFANSRTGDFGRALQEAKQTIQEYKCRQPTPAALQGAQRR